MNQIWSSDPQSGWFVGCDVWQMTATFSLWFMKQPSLLTSFLLDTSHKPLHWFFFPLLSFHAQTAEMPSTGINNKVLHNSAAASRTNDVMSHFVKMSPLSCLCPFHFVFRVSLSYTAWTRVKGPSVTSNGETADCNYNMTLPLKNLGSHTGPHILDRMWKLFQLLRNGHFSCFPHHCEASSHKNAEHMWNLKICSG